MSIRLPSDYLHSLRSAKPTVLNEQRVPTGALGEISVIPPIVIPPINTSILFEQHAKAFSLAKHPGLAAIDSSNIPEEFNWRDKNKNIAQSGNQMLCGSCWAISVASIVADNFVVAGKVNYAPQLSTTWCLACYPQSQCNGGNPAQLLTDISNHGITSDHCVDYSWCANNPNCNGTATKHFEAGKIDLSTLIPSCGCYDSSVPHLLYKIDKDPKSISLDSDGITPDNFALTVKKHIYTNGPVMGGFLVFSNFRSGAFTKVNGGVYLENGVYDKTPIQFDPAQTSPDNYVGSHAIAIVGWGVAKGIIIDNKGTKQDVPYWHCRNSWTPKWGDNGYFKMAMYPYNKLSQFDKTVVINAGSRMMRSGGMVMVSVSSPPEKLTLKQLSDKYTALKKLQPDSYYKTDDVLKKILGGGGGKPVGDNHPDSGSSGVNTDTVKKIGIVVGIILGAGLFLLLIFALLKRKSFNAGGRKGVYFI